MNSASNPSRWAVSPPLGVTVPSGQADCCPSAETTVGPDGRTASRCSSPHCRPRSPPAVHTSEVGASRAVLVRCEAALATPLRRVRRTHSPRYLPLPLCTPRARTAFGTLVPPRRPRSVADMGQVLERYHDALIPKCFVYDGVRRSM